MNIKLYVTLLKHQDSQIEYKKLIVMVDTSLRVSMLKRKIEQEFTELFPSEKPFICSKLEDQYGYSLSNSSSVGELLKNDDRLVAVPEEQGKGFVSSTDTRELLMMLSTIQENISGKLSDSALSAYNPAKELLINLLPLVYVSNPATMHNACIAISKALHEGNVMILDEAEHSDLLVLLVNSLQYLTMQFMEQDTVVQRAVLDIVEVAVRSKYFISLFKVGNTLQKMMSSSRSMNQTSKARMIRVISNLNRGTENWVDEPVKDYSFQTKTLLDPKSSDFRVEKNLEYRDSKNIDFRDSKNADFRESKKESGKKPGTREYQTSLQNSGMGGMVTDFILMLAPQNTNEMICFALHSLESFVSEAVDVAMNDSDLFSKCFNLVDLSTPQSYHSIQSDLLQNLALRLTQQRAEEIIGKSGITRLLKAYASQAERLQPSILQLFEQCLKLGRKAVEVPGLISVCLCPYPSINVLGMKTLAILADPADGFINDAQFENHIRFFITACTNEKQGQEYRNAAAECVANLSLREYLKPQIIYCGGVDCLLYMVKDIERVEAQRMAAKALVNLTSTKRDLKMKVVAELSDEIRKLYRNELDGIVSAYLQTLVSGR